MPINDGKDAVEFHFAKNRIMYINRILQSAFRTEWTECRIQLKIISAHLICSLVTLIHFNNSNYRFCFYGIYNYYLYQKWYLRA